jgi:hypothetical protein
LKGRQIAVVPLSDKVIGKVGRDNHSRISGGNVSSLLALWILARRQGIARWSTGGCHGMGIGKAKTVVGKAVNVRSLDSLCTIAFKITIT